MDLTGATDGLRRVLDEVGARPFSPGDPKLDGLAPSLVLEPEDASSCARALALCHQESLALVPLGAGTRIEVGNAPSRLDVYLSTAGLDGVEDYIPADLTVAVRAGTPLASLQTELSREGQFLPIDPPLAGRATVGGILAFGEPGLRRRPGARPRDLLLGFEAVLADGTPFKSGGRVVKNVSGYELVKLVVGSTGTLAVLTRAFLRVRALPEERETVAGDFRRASEAASAYRDVLRAPVAPEAAALLHPARAGSESWRLLLRYEGMREEAREGTEEARRRLGARASEELADDVWETVADFPAAPLPESTLVLRGQAVPARTFDLAELWRDGGPLVANPDAGLVYSHTEDPEALSDRIAQASRLGAQVVIERAPVDVKRERDVFGELPAGFELMRAIKEKLDPKGILSPGRFVGRI